MSFAVRTTTAFMTLPFFTRPRGIASFTDTTMMSPTPAYFRFEPPRTLMHMTRRAPELSATSRFVCIWIMALILSFFQGGFRKRVIARRTTPDGDLTSPALVLAATGPSAHQGRLWSGARGPTIRGERRPYGAAPSPAHPLPVNPTSDFTLSMSPEPSRAAPPDTSSQVFIFECGRDSWIETVSPT